MKRNLKVTILCAALMFVSVRAHAQWAVIDPTNLVQNILSAVQGASTAANTINNVNECIKIYKQGKEYYDALKSVHNLVKDARKVQRTVEMISDITKIYVNGFNRMVTDPSFTPDDLAAISEGYAILLRESADLLSDMKTIVTGGNGLSFSDKDRMDIIDKLYNEMKDYYNLTVYYTNRTMGVSYLRAKKKNDTERVLSLYGSDSERYW